MATQRSITHPTHIPCMRVPFYICGKHIELLGGGGPYYQQSASILPSRTSYPPPIFLPARSPSKYCKSQEGSSSCPVQSVVVCFDFESSIKTMDHGVNINVNNGHAVIILI